MKSHQEKTILLFFHIVLEQKEVWHCIYATASQTGEPVRKDSPLLLWFTIHLVLISSWLCQPLCPQRLIQFSSDWIFTADWPKLSSHLRTVPLTQLFQSSSLHFFCWRSQSPSRLSQCTFIIDFEVPLLFAPLHRSDFICCHLLQGRSVCATVTECWTPRSWSVHPRNRFIQRWGACPGWLKWDKYMI